MNGMNVIIAAETLGERAFTALKVSLIGMVIVFAALSIIWAAIEIMHAIVAAATKKKSQQAAPAEESADVALEAPEESGEDEAAVVAAITAAISVMLEEPVGSFRVVSFKRVGSNSNWNRQ